ncbi:hypothetical protein, partial [Photobacterium sp. 53610]|uniref:hypothetical protein n=1 Tax=Photobacterium sp. 53610 TaxID=3102789 RepID=UPI002ED9EBC2
FLRNNLLQNLIIGAGNKLLHHLLMGLKRSKNSLISVMTIKLPLNMSWGINDLRTGRNRVLGCSEFSGKWYSESKVFRKNHYESRFFWKRLKSLFLCTFPDLFQKPPVLVICIDMQRLN